MSDERPELVAVVHALSVGRPVEWQTVESGAADESLRAVLRELKVIAGVAEVYHSLPLPRPFIAPAPDAVSQPFETLARWGPLTLLEKVGRGSYGEVFRARDMRLDRDVALKLLRQDAPDADRREVVVVEEGRLLAKIRHPNVVTVYGADLIDGRVGIWMEFIHGRTLEDLLRLRGSYNAAEAGAIGIDVCRALAAVHRAGLMHRDIKAQNVMREEDGRIVLMDFGAGRDVREEVPPELAGTPLYLAPEIFQRQPATNQSDIYAVGVLLYHLVTGSYPVTGRTFREVRDAHREGRRARLLDDRPELDHKFAEVVEHALDPDPAQRHQTADALEAALADSLAEPAPNAVTTLRAAEPPVEAKAVVRPQRWLGIALTIAATAFISAGVVTLNVASLRDRLWNAVSRMPGGAGDPTTLAPARRAGQTTEAIARRVLQTDDVDGLSGLSSDGRYLTYVDWDTGDLALLELGTLQRRRLTNKGSWFDSDEYALVSTPSPDNTQVAYGWCCPGSTRELRLIRTDGSAPRVLLRSDLAAYIHALEWSPDGAAIAAAIQQQDGTNRIALISVSDGSLRTLKRLGAHYPQTLVFSPDGQHLAYDLPSGDNLLDRDIFALAIDGTRDLVLIQHPANDIVLGWPPDGRSLLFGSDRRGTMDVWALPVSDGKPDGQPELLRPALGQIWPLRLTSDGSYYYLLPIALSNVYVATLDATLSRVVAPPAEVLTKLVGSKSGCEWSPDGKYLAYVTRIGYDAASGNPVLVIRSLATGEEGRLVPPLRLVQRLRWSPDGRSMLGTGVDLRNQGGSFRIDLQTGEVSNIVSMGATGGWTRQAAWLPDGKAVLYWNVGDPIKWRDLATGSEQVVRPGGDFALSPDGHSLVVNSVDKGTRSWALKVVPLWGGQERELARGAGSGGFTLGCAWAPDGRRVLCVDGEKEELWRFSLDDGTSQRVLTMKGLGPVHVHPDGRRIAFMAGASKVELWVMENLWSLLGPQLARDGQQPGESRE